MEIIDIINRILKVSFINILIYLTVMKFINYKDNDKLKTFIIIAASIIGAIVEITLVEYIPTLLVIISIYIIHSLIIAKITKNKVQYSIIVTFISLATTYLVYSISVIITAILFRMINLNMKINNTNALFVIIGITYLILYAIFKVRRLKNGLSFLQNQEKVKNIGFGGIIIIGIVLLIYSKVEIKNSFTTNTYLFTGIIIETICMLVWIRRRITKYYKQKLKEKTIAELENEIKEKDEKIKKVLEENKAIAEINHKYSNRISALEKVSVNILSKPEVIEKLKVEFGEDFGEMQKQITRLSEEYSSEITEKIKHEKSLPRTGIFGIDNILEYMSSEAEKNNIVFNLKVNGNIKYMIENVIEQSKLETLLGDHIKDAIIAIKHSDNTYKNILVIIGIIEDCYEVCIYDTGIEFEINTLLKLGTKAITTHKDTGGSGIGFMTTFETLNLTKASLIIEEKHPMTNSDYTKAVRIRFNKKHQYKICSYRADEIKNKAEDDRIIIEDMI